MGGGILRPVATTTDLRYMNSSWEGYNLCHWEKSAPFQETQPTADISFTAAYKLVIGAFSVNPDCHFDGTKSFFASGPFLQELNVWHPSGKTDGRELKFSADQFVTLTARSSPVLSTVPSAISSGWTDGVKAVRPVLAR